MTPWKLLCNIHTLVKLTKRYRIYLYSNHAEAIIKYFVTNLNNLKIKNRREHLVDWCLRSFEIQAFVFPLSVAKRGACSQVFLAETVQTGDKNHDDFLCMQMTLWCACGLSVGDDWNDACKLSTFRWCSFPLIEALDFRVIMHVN